MNYKLGIFAFLFISLFSVNAQSNVDKNGVIIEGYDPVSFFSGEGVKGNPEHFIKYHGATYYFANKENKKTFYENPEKYKVQYGGWCAYAIAKGSKAGIDIKTGTVINGKLYFNYNEKIQKKFDKDQDGYIKKADANWKTLGKK